MVLVLTLQNVRMWTLSYLPFLIFYLQKFRLRETKAYKWMLTKLQLLCGSPVSPVSDGPAPLYHSDSHSLAHLRSFITGTANTRHTHHHSAMLRLEQTSLINQCPPFS